MSGKYERQARRQALKEAWNRGQDGFMCRYTGVKLDENDTPDPWYLSFDHRVPGNEGTLAVSARSVNTVKATLTARQFPRVMEALSGRLGGNPFDERVLQH